ncbi:dpoa decarboxylase [Salmonella enterica]|uniref:Dpoa decarboxylase n=1 Tax=Salmonella enterica TaxID=28901 RepID=A0A748ANK1_SALER|nr:dpoa decarboxylase [Salmonella enterica]EBX7269124.1 dpoa decarboxylase [Salmonella enterica subsp. enterica serovar Abony]ECE0795856.1 dpoa decarboxylase [Salmonella enterica subsp. enterica serovar Onderstepoort]ECI0231850.1 dpoa decarboxylase [Salmonella enterica subsp. enterica serovar Bahrenfeld]EDV4561619.1 dpoa decarboxylase [Salmonella enterica subsp. enterica]
MNKSNLFITNINSRHKDKISVALVYETLSKEAHRGCGLYYEIYESCFIGLLRDHLSELNEVDANKLRRYAESKGTKIDDASYSEALEAERECRAEIYREQM